MSDRDPAVRTILLPYEDPRLSSCRIPAERLGGIYDMEPAAPHPDLRGAIKEAVDHPIGTPPLREIASRGGRVAVLVDDMTRPTPAHEILPFLLAELEEAGIRKRDIIFVIAVGSPGR